MTERLQKILSARGISSRREAEKMILAGRVTVDGVPAVLGDSADPGKSKIAVDGKLLPEAGKNVYLMLNKPRGYVTTLSDEKGRPNAAQLVSGCGCRVYPVGRLDMDSEGLLLFTNDGGLTNALTHPKGEVEKEYLVKVRGYTPDSTALFARPIVLDGRPIRSPGITLLKSTGNMALYRMTIHEGRNRQIRRMAQAAGLQVLRLKRVREGRVSLGALPVGQWRYLNAAEIAALQDT